MLPLETMSPETLRQAAKILDSENARLIQENLKLQRELIKLKGDNIQE